MLKLGNHQTFIAAGTMPIANGITLISPAAVPGLCIAIESFTVTNGAEAWVDATIVELKDTAGNVFATIPLAALTANAVIGPHTAGVALGAAWGACGAVNKGLLIAPDVEETTGSPLAVRVTGQLVSP